MLKGVESADAREWQRAIFLRTDAGNAQLMLAKRFPPTLAPQTKADDEAIAREVERHKERMRLRREKEAAA